MEFVFFLEKSLIFPEIPEYHFSKFLELDEVFFQRNFEPINGCHGFEDECG